MPLNNFFHVNLPYGIQSNDKGEWAAFNRKSKPLGYSNKSETVTDKDFFYVKYKNINESILRELGGKSGGVQEEKGKIVKVYFYNDKTNPANSNNQLLYKQYFDKLRLLAELKTR